MADLLDLTVQGIRRAADEVDDALGRLRIRVLEIDDDRLALAQVVRDLLRVVKRLRLMMMTFICAATTFSRTDAPE